MAKMITVFGATGTQGGSLVKALLKDGNYKIRGVTRNVESDKAKALTQQGVEMVKASLDDVTSLEKAMEGSYGVFGMTNYWELFDKAKEVQMGKNLVDAAKKAGVQHLVYSGLQNVSKLIGKSCPHFDGKAEVEEYMFKSDVPATSVRFAGYMENFFSQLAPQKTGEGVYEWNLPMEGKPMPMLMASASGGAILSIFKNLQDFKGKAVGLAGDHKTVAEYCEIINKYVAPVKITAGQITAEQFGKLGFPGADDLGVMFEFYQTEFAEYSVMATRALDPDTKDFESFIKENKDKVVAQLK